MFVVNRTLRVFLALTSLASSSHICPNTSNFYENYLGSKTPYRFVGNQNSTAIKFPGCEASKLWAVVRHGTRNPNAQLIDKIKTRLNDIRDQILDNFSFANDEIHNSDLDLFRRWSTKLEAKDEKKLTHEGEDEMLLLAERLQNRFPEVLGHVYSDSAYQFKFTATQRTKRSAQYFTAGLFGRGVVKNVYFPEPLKKDPILRFYKLCSKWRKDVSKNPNAVIERRKFEGGKIMTETIQKINQRLGFKDELSFSDIHMMYMVCAFETAWNKRKRSPWCSAFRPDDLKVIEYAEDLKYYWVDGYGHELTHKQACPAVNDMIEFFDNESYPKASVYFTHSGTLLKMLAYLGLYEDQEPLTADNFNLKSDRKWRVSKIDSFGTNLVFVLFKCGNERNILTLHQENIVRLPSCLHSDLCPLETFKQYYNGSVNCAFDEICDNDV